MNVSDYSVKNTTSTSKSQSQLKTPSPLSFTDPPSSHSTHSRDIDHGMNYLNAFSTIIKDIHERQNQMHEIENARESMLRALHEKQLEREDKRLLMDREREDRMFQMYRSDLKDRMAAEERHVNLDAEKFSILANLTSQSISASESIATAEERLKKYGRFTTEEHDNDAR